MEIEARLRQIREFFEKHQRRILRELKEQGIPLTLENIPRIIEATSFRKRRMNYTESCPCYIPNPGISTKSIPCHPIKDLNCFLCGCPHYPSEEPSQKCRLNEKYGHHIPFPNPPTNLLLDCNGCSQPHFKETIEQYLRENIERLKDISATL